MHSEFEKELFTPEVVLPVQMSYGARCDGDTSGVRALILAILEDAVRCIARGRRRRHRHDRQLAEAEAWVRCDSREWPFSFASICDVLGIDAEAMRFRLLAAPERSAGRAQQTAPPSNARGDADGSRLPRKMLRAKTGEPLAA